VIPKKRLAVRPKTQLTYRSSLCTNIVYNSEDSSSVSQPGRLHCTVSLIQRSSFFTFQHYCQHQRCSNERQRGATAACTGRLASPATTYSRLHALRSLIPVGLCPSLKDCSARHSSTASTSITFAAVFKYGETVVWFHVKIKLF